MRKGGLSLFKEIDFFDCLCLIGVVLVGAGLWFYDPRIATIVVGSILLFAGIKGSGNP